jgi:hypothetical protein
VKRKLMSRHCFSAICGVLRRNTPEQRIWGAFTERGVTNIPMNSGTNVRIFNDAVKVQKTSRYYLEHQNGDKVTAISLEIYHPNIKMPDGSISTNHAFAPLSSRTSSGHSEDVMTVDHV